MNCVYPKPICQTDHKCGCNTDDDCKVSTEPIEMFCYIYICSLVTNVMEIAIVVSRSLMSAPLTLTVMGRCLECVTLQWRSKHNVSIVTTVVCTMSASQAACMTRTPLKCPAVQSKSQFAILTLISVKPRLAPHCSWRLCSPPAIARAVPRKEST